MVPRRTHRASSEIASSPDADTGIMQVSSRHRERSMFTSGGGGGLPSVNSPFEALIVLLFFSVVV